MLKGFKDFLMRGNVVDLAVAVIIAGAFGKVIEAFVTIVMDIIGKLGGQPDFSAWAPGGVHLGSFITVTISFLIIAAAVYAIVVVPLNKIAERRKAGEGVEDLNHTHHLFDHETPRRGGSLWRPPRRRLSPANWSLGQRAHIVRPGANLTLGRHT